jgi:hypothetical protein
VAGHGGTGFRANPRNRVQHTGGQKSIANRRDEQGREGCVLGHFQHDGVTGTHGRCDFYRRQSGWCVPRHNRADHAQRFATGVAESVFAQRHGVALQLSAQTTEITEDLDAGLRLGTSLGTQGVAGFIGDDTGQILDSRFEGIGDLKQRSSADRGGDFAPGRERGFAGTDRAFDVGCRAARGAGDCPFVGWTLDRQGAPVEAGYPLTID